MLHGNLLLRGWQLSDVSFYLTELPEYVLVVAVRGLRPDVVQICAALTYTLCVLLVVLVAKADASGREAVVRAALSAGIALAPLAADQRTLLSNPDHTGTAVPILLMLLLVRSSSLRYREFACVVIVLSAALISDQLTLVIGVAPLLTVCLLVAIQQASACYCWLWAWSLVRCAGIATRGQGLLIRVSGVASISCCARCASPAVCGGACRPAA